MIAAIVDNNNSYFKLMLECRELTKKLQIDSIMFFKDKASLMEWDSNYTYNDSKLFLVNPEFLKNEDLIYMLNREGGVSNYLAIIAGRSDKIDLSCYIEYVNCKYLGMLDNDSTSIKKVFFILKRLELLQ
ncbi:hypothetical protein FKQ60_09370 [Vibrio sp. A11]|uniref:hypothetical protein n=1 Tax=Vibrio sp. A11 TaxID=2591464 RepID=UPI001481E22F|nr:hypothetical protein [Vibrio sp. A11]NNN61059.1 hypothetical protein [Vibrio sp. A11]